jgi:cytochrome c553
MKYLYSTLTLITGSVLLTSAHSADMEYGKMLYQKNCVSCHSSEVFTRENHMVNNFAELKERIRQCELSNDLTWFDEDIDAVVNYLNTTYYKFEIE